jgi:hypothetical protein
VSLPHVELDLDRLLDLDVLLDENYLAGLEEMSLAEVRDRRTECWEVEDALSVLRRMVQGRLDIVHADLQRRAGGLEGGDIAQVVEQLPEILSEGGRSAQVRGRLPKNIAPDVNYRKLTAELDRIIDVDTSAGLLGMDDERVRSIAEALEDLERQVSSRRRAVQERIDALQAEVVRRYKSGDADVDGLLR